MSMKQAARNVYRGGDPGSAVNMPAIDPITNLFANVRHTRATVAALLADTSLTYTAGSAHYVAAGDVVQAGTFSYTVLVLGTASYSIATAGGVLLQVLRPSGGLQPEQFGADPTGATDSAPALQKWLDWLTTNGGFGVSRGTYRVEFPESPSDPLGLAALYMSASTTKPPVCIDASGSKWLYYGDPDTYMLRGYQSGNQAEWPTVTIAGGYFDGTGVTDPAGCILWDDMGQCRMLGMHFNGWSRAAGNENAYAIHQRNFDSWSENTTHEGHIFTNCDLAMRFSLAEGEGGTFSMARTRLANLFLNGCKAFGVQNGVAMYDSVIENIKGNGGRIAWIRQSGGAVANTLVQGLKTEQGRSVITNETGAMTAGSAVLTVTTGTPFASWMAQGQRVTVAGAGAAGADLVSYITAFTSATEVTLAHAASTTVSDETVTLGATASIIEAGSLHQFEQLDVRNRDGGVNLDIQQFTGSDTEPRQVQTSGINSSGRVSSAIALEAPVFVSSKTDKAERIAFNAAGNEIWPNGHSQVSAPTGTATTVMTAGDATVDANAAWMLVVCAIDNTCRGAALVTRQQGTASAAVMTLATASPVGTLTFAVNSNAVQVTQTTGATKTLNVIATRIN